MEPEKLPGMLLYFSMLIVKPMKAGSNHSWPEFKKKELLSYAQQSILFLLTVWLTWEEQLAVFLAEIK